MKKTKVAKNAQKVTIDNREWFEISMTIGELLDAISQSPNNLINQMISDAGPNLDLSIIPYEHLSSELRTVLGEAGALDDESKSE